MILIASPRYTFNFRHLARIENAVGQYYCAFSEVSSSVPVRYPTVSGANIKCQDEFAIGSIVR